MSTRKAVPQPGTGEDKERGLTGMERQAIQRSRDLMSRLLPPSGERCGVWGNAPDRGSRVADPREVSGQRPDIQPRASDPYKLCVALYALLGAFAHRYRRTRYRTAFRRCRSAYSLSSPSCAQWQLGYQKL